MDRASAERHFNDTGDIVPLQRAVERDGDIQSRESIIVLSGLIAAVFGTGVVRALALRRPGGVRFTRCEQALTDLRSYWDGGTRQSWERLNLETGQRYTLLTYVDPSTYVDPNPEPSRVTPDATWTPIPGEGLIDYTEGGTRGGIRIYSVTLHPDDYFRIWWASKRNAPDISRDERIVLAATRSFKASYGGIKNLRMHEAMRETDITAERWDAAKVSLIQQKMLNRAGALTPKGRAAIGDTNLHKLRS